MTWSHDLVDKSLWHGKIFECVLVVGSIVLKVGRYWILFIFGASSCKSAPVVESKFCLSKPQMHMHLAITGRQHALSLTTHYISYSWVHLFTILLWISEVHCSRVNQKCSKGCMFYCQSLILQWHMSATALLHILDVFNAAGVLYDICWLGAIHTQTSTNTCIRIPAWIHA